MVYKIIAVVFIINALFFIINALFFLINALVFKNHHNKKSIASDKLKLCFTSPKAKL